MDTRRRYMAALFTLTLSCGGTSTSAEPEPVSGGPPTEGGSASTGLEGTAYRSPTQPVCRLEEPCRAPFSAGFEVRQGDRVVASFHSDPAGHFLVSLPPGRYAVGPDASAPLLARSQVHEVTVGPTGLTHVDLDFDTGIR